MSRIEDTSKFTTFVIILAAMIAWMHDGYSLVMISLLGNTLKDYFGVNDAALGLIISLQFVFTVPGAILFGELGDRFGRKKALILSIAWDAIFSSLTALVPQNAFWLFGTLRLISGLGVSWGLSFSLISEHFSPKRRGAAGGLVHSTFVLGYISAIIVTMLVSKYGWQWCFVTALFPIPFLVLFWFALPESAIWSELDQVRKDRGIKQKIRVREIFGKKWLKLTILLILLFWLAEMAYHAMVDFAPVFFEYFYLFLGNANYENAARSYMLIIMIIAALGLFFFGFLSDYIGRKKAFFVDNLVGIFGGLIFAFCILIFFNNILIQTSTIFITLGFGLHGIFGVWSSELYDTDVRASANSIIFSVARGASFGGFLVGLISDSLNPYLTQAERLAHPFTSLHSLGIGMLLSLIAYIGIILVVYFVPEPKDKVITALSKSDVIKP
ncbi:MAG: MFS transporter [Promethearchaeota archaeon]